MSCGQVPFSPGTRSPEFREIPFSQSIDNATCKRKAKRGLNLDGGKSPFADKIHLPKLALPRKARGDEGKSDVDPSRAVDTPQALQRSTYCNRGAMKTSSSLPSLHGNRTPPQAMHFEVKRRNRLAVDFSRQDTKSTEDSPCAASKTSGSSRTPSTAIGFQSSQLAASLNTTCGSATSSSSARSAEQQLSWRQGEEIGSGTYGCVYMAQCKTTGKIFAAKVAKIKREEDRKYAEKQQHELDIIKDLRHRHIVACLGHEFMNKTLYIYLEYVPGGSLRRMLNDFGALDEPLLIKATRGIAKGLHYLHRRDPPVVHRDLKGANVLVDLDFCVKLADFGCSKRDTTTQSFSKVGSIHWVAPEVLQNGGHGRKADIWSLGCVVIEMATAEDPWGSDAFDNIWAAVHMVSTTDRRPPIPDSLSESARDFVDRCLQRQPDLRPNIADLVEHPFVLRAAGVSCEHSVRSNQSSKSSIRRSSAWESIGAGSSARSSVASTALPATPSRPSTRSSSLSRLG